MFRRFSNALCLAAIIAPAMIAASCISHEVAAPGRSWATVRPEPLPDNAWPVRNSEWCEAKLAAVGSKAPLVHRTVVREDERLIPIETRETLPVLSKRRAGNGLVFEFARPASHRFAAGGDRQIAFMSRARPGASAATAPPPAADEVDGVILDVLEPLNAEVRGIVFHLHGLGGVEYEQPVAEALRQHGYLVLQGEFPWSRWQQRQIELGNEAELEATAIELAAMVDDCEAEMAYAAEAVVEHVWQTRPEYRGKPVLVLGFSAGSMVGVTMGVRLGDKTAGVILVGSGCNLAYIVQTSDLTDGGVSIQQRGRRITGPMAGLLSGRYIGRTRLDPYHTATYLLRTPVLLIHASGDTIVPSDCGEELYDRLGRPERFIIQGGHRTLFLQVGGLSERIADWVDQAVADWRQRPK